MTKQRPRGGPGNTRSSRPSGSARGPHRGCSKKRAVIKDRLRSLQKEVTHLQAELSVAGAILTDILRFLKEVTGVGLGEEE